jgi:DNA-binding beta-propeller fold protein YncE
VNVAALLSSEDGSRAVAVGVGRPDLRSPKPEQSAAVHAFDTQTAQITSVHTVPRLVSVLAKRDGSRVFVLTARKSEGRSSSIAGAERLALSVPNCLAALPARLPKEGSYTLKIIDPVNPQPIAEIAVPGAISGMVLSEDERWVYLMDEGRVDSNPKRRREGAVHIVDVESATLSGTHAVGIFPQTFDIDPLSGELRTIGHASSKDHRGNLFRFVGNDPLPATDIGEDPLEVVRVEGWPDSILITRKEICLLDNRGHPNRPCIELSKLGATEKGKPIGFGFAQDRLVEVTPLGNRSEFLLRTGDDGDRIAFADWKSGRITNLITIGRPGARLKKQTRNNAGRALLLGVFLMGCAGAGRCGSPSMPEVVEADPWTSVPPWVRPDSRYAYITNSYTSDLTALDTERHAITAYFPLDGRPRGLFMFRDRDLICAFSKNRLIVVDSATNQSVFEANPTGGIRQVTLSPDGSQLLAITEHQIAGWSTKTWQPIGVLQGLSKPHLVMD